MRYGKRSLVVFLAVLPQASLAQMPATKVVARRAEMRSLPATMQLVATVEPAVRSVIGAEVEGLVVEMPARQGDFVENGGVICRLNDDTLSAALASARARLGGLQAQLDELEAGTRPEELARLKAACAEAEARHRQWAAEKQRVDRLKELGRANEKEVYDTEADYLAAEQRMLAARAQLEEGVNGPRAEVIAQARFAVAEQGAIVRRAEHDQAKTVICAPFAGFVVRRETELGQWTQRGGPIVELLDLSSVLVTVDAPEQAFPYVGVGDPARVQVDALGEVFAGRVKHVVWQADVAARAFPVQIEINNPQVKLKGGMLAWATVTTGPETEVVAVPKDAVDVRRGTPCVCVVAPTEQGTMAMPTSVTTGADIDDWIAITSGNIAPGTLVVVRGNERILFPSPVQVTNMEVPGMPPPSDTPRDPSEAAAER